jgi:DNA polymerase elongation subunit (family B)
MAEYGKIVCISVWYEDEQSELKLKSFVWADERDILVHFADMLSDKNIMFVWHNIKWFDLPFLIKRYWINNIVLPKQLHFRDKKPWKVEVIDTMELRSGNGRREWSALEVITLALWIANPKQNTDGWHLLELYKLWKFDEIAQYCEWDVTATRNVYKRIA